MSKAQLGTLIGFALGAVWAIAGFPGAVLTAFLAGLGFFVGQVVEGRVDLTEYLGRSGTRR